LPTTTWRTAFLFSLALGKLEGMVWGWGSEVCGVYASFGVCCLRIGDRKSQPRYLYVCYYQVGQSVSLPQASRSVHNASLARWCWLGGTSSRSARSPRRGQPRRGIGPPGEGFRCVVIAVFQETQEDDEQLLHRLQRQQRYHEQVLQHHLRMSHSYWQGVGLSRLRFLRGRNLRVLKLI